MRRILATTVLLAAALLWAGCGGSQTDSKSSTNMANSTGTTTYGNASTGASGGSAAPMATQPPAANTSTGNRGPGGPGIKPPTDK